MGDKIEMTRSVVPMSYGSKTRTRMTTLMSFGSRMKVPMSFGSRMRSVLGGDDLDGGASAGVRSWWWCDLEGGDNMLQVVAGFRWQQVSIGSGVQVSGSSSLSLSQFR